MIITDKTEQKEMIFKTLGIGDVFRYGSGVFLKVSWVGSKEPNTFDLNKCCLTNFTADTKVEYIPSELVLHEPNWKN